MSFKDIHGHEKQIRILQNAALGNRLSHAYLFYGMEGIGKTTVAASFAKALNCEIHKDTETGLSAGNGDFDSCDHCSSCFKAARNNHPDIITIKPDKQFIRIKEIREIQEQMNFAPLEGRMRVFMMPDAEKMNIVSANALLKTLEEPSRSNILILITASPHQLPVTIVSRCQPVRFNPLKNETIASFLQERLSLESGKAVDVASSSAGSIGKALAMSDDLYLESRNEILRIMLMDPEKEPLKFMSMVSHFSRDKGNISDTFNILLSGYRDALVYKETANKGSLVNRQSIDVIKSVAYGLSGREILQNIRTIDWAIQAIARNANKQLTLEAMLFKFARCHD